jgi:hypothetical protein
MAVTGVNADAGPIYFSTNSGATWLTANVPNRKWWSAGASADGNTLLAGTGGELYIWQPAPTLSVSAANGNLTLSWPASASRFTLQQTGDCGSTSWTDVTNAATVVNSVIQVVLPPQAGQTFFRLRL